MEHGVGKTGASRPLNPSERAVLELLLSVPFDGAEELREQLRSATVVGRCSCGCPSIDLAVAEDAPRAPHAERLAPVEVTTDAEQDVMLFLDEGRLSYLELVDYSEDVPADWPPVEQMSVLVR